MRVKFQELISDKKPLPQIGSITKDQAKAIVQSFITGITDLLRTNASKFESESSTRPIMYAFINDYDDWCTNNRYTHHPGSELEALMANVLGFRKT